MILKKVLDLKNGAINTKINVYGVYVSSFGVSCAYAVFFCFGGFCNVVFAGVVFCDVVFAGVVFCDVVFAGDEVCAYKILLRLGLQLICLLKGWGWIYMF